MPVPSAPEITARRRARRALAGLMIAAGAAHLVAPEAFLPAMPPGLPAPRALIYLSGAAEMACGVGLLARSARTRRVAGWALALLFVAVYPANVHLALAAEGTAMAWPWLLRLPLQGALAAWALRASGALRARPCPMWCRGRPARQVWAAQ